MDMSILSMKCNLPGRTTFWYKCLVCHRCFQFPEKLILHKRNTECGRLYRIRFPNLFPERKIISARLCIEEEDNHSTTFPKPFESHESSRIRSRCASVETVLCLDSILKPEDANTSSFLLNNNEAFEGPVDSRVTRKDFTDSVESQNINNSYNCYFCNLKLNQYTDLVDHIREHTGEGVLLGT